MVQKIVKGTNLELTEAIHSAVDKVVEGITRYIDPADTSALAEVEVSRTTHHHKSGDIFRAEINLRTKIGSMRVEVSKEDLYVALTQAKDELAEMLRSKKSKRLDVVRKSGLKLKNMLRELF